LLSISHDVLDRMLDRLDLMLDAMGVRRQTVEQRLRFRDVLPNRSRGRTIRYYDHF
jgi:hypothetical protein